MGGFWWWKSIRVDERTSKQSQKDKQTAVVIIRHQRNTSQSVCVCEKGHTYVAGPWSCDALFSSVHRPCLSLFLPQPGSQPQGRLAPSRLPGCTSRTAAVPGKRFAGGRPRQNAPSNREMFTPGKPGARRGFPFRFLRAAWTILGLLNQPPLGLLADGGRHRPCLSLSLPDRARQPGSPPLRPAAAA